MNQSSHHNCFQHYSVLLECFDQKLQTYLECKEQHKWHATRVERNVTPYLTTLFVMKSNNDDVQHGPFEFLFAMRLHGPLLTECLYLVSLWIAKYMQKNNDSLPTNKTRRRNRFVLPQLRLMGLHDVTHDSSCSCSASPWACCAMPTSAIIFSSITD